MARIAARFGFAFLAAVVVHAQTPILSAPTVATDTLPIAVTAPAPSVPVQRPQLVMPDSKALTNLIESINFDGEAATSGLYHIPPDPSGAAGPNHLVSVVNTSIWWATRSGTGVTAQSLWSLFSSVNGATGRLFDPKVIYDQYAGRFVVVCLERRDTAQGDPSNTSRTLVAVSDDADPNGTWRCHAINSLINVAGVNHWADYPGIAIDEEAVYITANLFSFGTPRTFGGARLWIVNKTPFYSGGAASVTVHDPSGATGQSATTMMPAHTFGTPPAGVGTWLVRYTGITDGTNEYLSVIRVDSPLASPSFSHQFVALGNIDNTSIANFPGAPQLGSATTIESGDRRVLHAVWRNNGLYCVTTVLPPSGTDAGECTTHWVKINATTMLMVDQGNVGGEDIQNGAHTYWATLAVNASDTMAVGFALSGSSTYAGAYFVTRFATDPPGTVSSTEVLAPGLASYVRTFGTGRNRWGDYSGMAVDPVDDAAFWVYNEYPTTQGTQLLGENGRWATRFGRITLGPSVTMASAMSTSTNVSPIPVTATFSEPVTGFTVSDILETNATVSGFSAVSGSVYTFNLVPLGQGTVTADIPAGAAMASGVANQAATQFVRVYDTIAPTISIGVPSVSATNTGPVTYTITYGGADTVTLAPANITLNRTGTASGTLSVTGAGAATRDVTISSITGNGTIGISIAANTATDAAGNSAPAAGPSATFAVDTTAPTVSIGAPSATTTTAGPVSYTITYGGANAILLSTGHVSLNTTGTATGVVAVSGSGLTTRTVTISSIAGNGTIGISIAPGTATDSAGNQAPSAGPSATFTVDNSGPGISIGAPSPGSTRNGPITFAITYSGATSVSLTPANVTLVATGTATGAIAVSGSGLTSRTVAINGVSGDGTLAIAVAVGTAQDGSGNLAPAAGPSAAATVDNTAPTVSIGAPSTAVTASGPVTFPITYAGASSITLSAANVSLIATGTATGTVAVSGTVASARTVTISSVSGDGTLAISLAAGTAVDALANAAPAAGPSASFDVDSTPIGIVVSAPSVALTRSGPVNFTVTYTNVETVTLAPANVSLNRLGTANGIVSVSGAKVDGTFIRTVTVDSITGNGTIGITINSGTATDTDGHVVPSSGPSATFGVDNVAPTVSIGQPSPAITETGPVSYPVTYTGSTTVTLAAGDVTVHSTGTASAGNVSVTGFGTGSRTVTLSSIAGDGRLSISIAAGTASDTAGNLAPTAGPSGEILVFSDFASLPLRVTPVVTGIILVAVVVAIRRSRAAPR